MRQIIDVEGLTAIDVELSRVYCLNNGDIYTKRDLFEKLDAIAACASLLELRKYESGEVKIHNANYCHNPVVCPVCADRVSKRRRALFSDPIKRAVRRFAVNEACGDWRSEYPKGYTGVYFATATIKDGNNLKERIDTLLNAIKKMRKMGQKREAGRSKGEWSKVRAGISNVEIKIGSGSGSWHVHTHFLLFTDSPIDIRTDQSPYFIDRENGEKYQVSKFNHEWYTATHGEGINFDVRPVEFKNNVHGRECKTFEESVEAQAQEVLKYSTLLSTNKGTDILNAAQYIELIQRRGNRRLFNTIGLLRCDKRNPDCFMTITERELRRLEYVDKMDSKCYEVYAARWNTNRYGKVSKMDGAIFKNSDDMSTQFKNIHRHAFMAQTAKYQGEYRKLRNHFLKYRYLFHDKNSFENVLDETRNDFRVKVSGLWQNYGDINFIPEFLTGFDSEGMAIFKARILKQAA
jgi:plasmid rolling circle replication initiator protein Rep